MNLVTEQKTCRICGSTHLETIVDLGSIYPSGFVPKDMLISESMKAPLVLVRCNHCKLVQLKHTVELDLMYRQYWYSSGLNKSMVSSLQDIVNDIESQIEILEGDTVLDIGCNDGTLLNLYSSRGGIRTIGVDPARNLKKPNCSRFINDYFSADEYWKEETQKAKIITAIAMFYDLPDPASFLDDVVSVLDPAGKFVLQFTDLRSMLEVNAFDNICHEHLEYYSFEVVKFLLNSAGLEVISVTHNDVNGASIRVVAAFPGKYTVDDSIRREINIERAYLTWQRFENFKDVIETTKRKLRGFLKWARAGKHTTYILGASTKGETLAQVCGITVDDIPFAAEINKEKFGLKMLGTNILIISQTEALIKHPEYFVVLPWHFKKSILEDTSIIDYINSGGKLVFPLPRLSVVSTTGEYFL